MPTWNLRVDNCEQIAGRSAVTFDVSFAKGALGGASGNGYEFDSLASLKQFGNITDQDIERMLMKILIARLLISGVSNPADVSGKRISITLNAGGGSLVFA